MEDSLILANEDDEMIEMRGRLRHTWGVTYIKHS